MFSLLNRVTPYLESRERCRSSGTRKPAILTVGLRFLFYSHIWQKYVHRPFCTVPFGSVWVLVSTDTLTRIIISPSAQITSSNHEKTQPSGTTHNNIKPCSSLEDGFVIENLRKTEPTSRPRSHQPMEHENTWLEYYSIPSTAEWWPSNLGNRMRHQRDY